MNKKILYPIILSSSLFLWNNSVAAEDAGGNLLETAMIINIEDLIFDDMVVGDEESGGLSAEVCVYSNEGATGTYKVKLQSQNDASGVGTAGDFVLNGPNGNTMNYFVAWDEDKSDGDEDMVPLTEDTLSGTMAVGNIPTSLVSCAASEMAEVLMLVPNSEMVGKEAGYYSDVVTFTVVNVD